jgi:hypothetical protein
MDRKNSNKRILEKIDSLSTPKGRKKLKGQLKDSTLSAAVCHSQNEEYIS